MIRRTEGSGNGQQLAWRFKDLLYFRSILRDYDISLMRDYLQTHIEAVHIKKD